MIRSPGQGFTTVEVLVTLFIIGFFLAAGYQAYSLVVSGTHESRTQNEASNVAYAELRRLAGTVGTTCSASTPTASIPSGSTLPAPQSISAQITCPFGTTSKISLVTVSLTYGPTNKKVTHAIYAQ